MKIQPFGDPGDQEITLEEAMEDWEWWEIENPEEIPEEVLEEIKELQSLFTDPLL